MDLADAIQWAGNAATRGTDANSVVEAGLRSIFHATGEIGIINPVSSARDGITPDLTRVLLCDVEIGEQMQRVCVKLYPYSPEGKSALYAHAHLLTALKKTVPVPDVIEVVSESDLLGFPALVTTASGQPLDAEIGAATVELQEQIIARVAVAVAALHACDPGDLSIDSAYDPNSIYRLWQEDAAWYEEHSSEAGGYASLVLAGAAVLAKQSYIPTHGSVLHRDLTPYNILGHGGGSIILIDWDHAGFSASQEDVGKILIGFLSMLSIPRELRLILTQTFLDAYSQLRLLSTDELLRQSLPFALDTLLDWVVGCKNAPQEELAWATEQILKYERA